MGTFHKDRINSLAAEGVQEKLVQYIWEGNYFSVACRAAGTWPKVVKYWHEKLEAGDDRAKKYEKFFNQLEHATAQAEVCMVRRIRRGQKGWGGASWLLERRFAERWTDVKNQKQDIKVNVKHVPVVELPLKDLHGDAASTTQTQTSEGTAE
jgi:hypothetical protein